MARNAEMTVLSIPQPRLTLEDVAAAAQGAQVALSRAGAQNIARAGDWMAGIIAAGKPVYGVNTGFGALADKAIPLDKVSELQLNLIRSHAAGAGEPLKPDEVRAAMFLRANMLSKGYSGVSRDLVEQMLALLNRGVVPVVPEFGSVGASGDLAPLAHIALVLVGRGDAWFKGRRMKGAAALRAAGIEPYCLRPKEGLSLINGTEVMAAIGALAILNAERLSGIADLAGALTCVATKANPRVFAPDLQRLKPHPGQAKSAANLYAYLRGARFDHARVQDAYSIRCMPQVHGAARDGIAFGRGICETEINSVTDNPVLMGTPPQGKSEHSTFDIRHSTSPAMVSGGNFHGEAIAFALDMLAIALTQLAAISERRIFRLLDPNLSGLPAFLVAEPGLNSGLMIAQLLAASLVTDCKQLSAPASIHSLPTSANQEDFVSMGMNSALKARKVLDHLATVLATEILCAAQGIELSHHPIPPGLAPALSRIRAQVPPFRADREIHPAIAKIKSLLPDIGA
jgi:histidine ammonia-lyase